MPRMRLLSVGDSRALHWHGLREVANSLAIGVNLPLTMRLLGAPDIYHVLLHSPMGWFILFFALIIAASLINQIFIALGISSARRPQRARQWEQERATPAGESP